MSMHCELFNRDAREVTMKIDDGLYDPMTQGCLAAKDRIRTLLKLLRLLVEIRDGRFPHDRWPGSGRYRSSLYGRWEPVG
jgi:hypothetical protein